MDKARVLNFLESIEIEMNETFQEDWCEEFELVHAEYFSIKYELEAEIKREFYSKYVEELTYANVPFTRYIVNETAREKPYEIGDIVYCNFTSPVDVDIVWKRLETTVGAKDGIYKVVGFLKD